jgi:hypothetical protein
MIILQLKEGNTLFHRQLSLLHFNSAKPVFLILDQSRESGKVEKMGIIEVEVETT